MNNPIAYLLIFFFFILFSCQTRSAYDISFEEMPFENAPLISITIKDIYDLPYLIPDAEWEYVILEQTDNSLLGDLEKVVFADGKWVVLDGNSNLLVFTEQGKFLFRVGALGQGPGEYIKINDFSVTQNDKIVWVLDMSERVLSYSLEDGQPLKEGRIIGYEAISLRAISAVNDSIFYLCRMKLDQAQLLSEVLRVENFRVISGAFNKKLPYDTLWAYEYQKHFSVADFKGRFLYSSIYSDTIYQFDPHLGNVSPYIWVDWGKHTFNSNDYKEAKSRAKGDGLMDMLRERKKFIGWGGIIKGDSFTILNSSLTEDLILLEEQGVFGLLALGNQELGYLQLIGVKGNHLVGVLSGEQFFKDARVFFGDYKSRNNLSDQVFEAAFNHVKKRYPKWNELRELNGLNNNPILIISKINPDPIYMPDIFKGPISDFHEYVQKRLK